MAGRASLAPPSPQLRQATGSAGPAPQLVLAAGEPRAWTPSATGSWGRRPQGDGDVGHGGEYIVLFFILYSLFLLFINQFLFLHSCFVERENNGMETHLIEREKIKKT